MQVLQSFSALLFTLGGYLAAGAGAGSRVGSGLGARTQVGAGFGVKAEAGTGAGGSYRPEVQDQQ